ncbi:MAG: alpha/beta fold hydrolase [Sphingobacteriales bacterium]|nr:MAG: alpha/beta fold hydrolase [Sphingobacteriales bacterium]
MDISSLEYGIKLTHLEGGGHTSLAWAIQNDQEKDENKSKVLMVVIPGLTGTANDKYVRDIVGNLLKNGYRCVVYQPRFNGGQLILPDEGYLDILKDFKSTMDQLRQKEKDAKLFGVGHSYGANLLVNYLGSFEDNGFVGGVSIANPWNLMLGESKMRRTVVDRVMCDFLQKTANKSSKQLSEAVRFDLNLQDLLSFKHVRDFDRNFTIKVYGYETVNDYYWAISSCRRIKNIKVPLLVLNAEDDPVVEANGFVKEEIENSSPNVIVMMTPRGGHQGWVEGFFSLKRWYMKPAVEFVNAVINTSQ